MAELYCCKGYGVCFRIYFGKTTWLQTKQLNKKDDLEQASKLVKNYNIDKGYEDVVNYLPVVEETPKCNGLVTTVVME